MVWASLGNSSRYSPGYVGVTGMAPPLIWSRGRWRYGAMAVAVAALGFWASAPPESTTVPSAGMLGLVTPGGAEAVTWAKNDFLSASAAAFRPGSVFVQVAVKVKVPVGGSDWVMTTVLVALSSTVRNVRAKAVCVASFPSGTVT